MNVENLGKRSGERMGNMVKFKILVVVIVLFTLSLVGCSSNATQTTSSSPTDQISQEQKQQQEAEKQRQEAEKQAKMQEALKNLETKKDDVKEITWYRGYDLEKSDYSGISTYLGSKKIGDKNQVWMRLLMQFHGRDWVFFDKVYFKTDTKTHEINIPFNAKQTKVIMGNGVMEWYDCSVNQKNYDMLMDIANSQKVIMRFEGKQGYKDRTVTDGEKEYIKYVIDVFNGMNGTFIEPK